MTYYDRRDIALQYELADTFTILAELLGEQALGKPRDEDDAERTAANLRGARDEHAPPAPCKRRQAQRAIERGARIEKPLLLRAVMHGGDAVGAVVSEMGGHVNSLFCCCAFSMLFMIGSSWKN